MTCPRCKLENPPSSLYRDCGHEFVAGSRTVSKAEQAPEAASKLRWLAVPGAGLFGGVVTYILMTNVHAKTDAVWFYPLWVDIFTVLAALGCALIALVSLLIKWCGERRSKNEI